MSEIEQHLGHAHPGESAVLAAERDGSSQQIDGAIVLFRVVPERGGFEQDLTALVGVAVEFGFGLRG
ncbi:hypothetical protein [Nocardia jinanensis]|uniref:hypothetical protein n=1 Tax=Nocardia jinanensis TaxID=382504 RepID=UPI0012E3B49F|nr:hypothetical protein [Nocardia jinanensis]